MATHVSVSFNFPSLADHYKEHFYIEISRTKTIFQGRFLPVMNNWIFYGPEKHLYHRNKIVENSKFRHFIHFQGALFRI